MRMQWIRSASGLAILLAGCGGGDAIKDGSVLGPGDDGGLAMDGSSEPADGSDGDNDGSDTDGDPDGSGGDGDDDGGVQVIPDPVVTPCNELKEKGVWENITPPVTTLPGNAPCPFGGHIVVNPQDPAMLYAGTCNQGIWKTTDCGATWTHINTGKNGAVLDAGRQWTFEIDPINPDVLYTNSGYGALSNGAFKSSNGGVDWDVLWPPEDSELSSIVTSNFVGTVAIDPSDHEHLLVSFHAECAAPHTEACIAETEDAGATWHMVDGRPEWAGGEGQLIYFLNNRDTWLWGSQSNGLWRTDDGGDSWTAVTDNNAQGHSLGQMYRAKNGAFYLPVSNGILRSPDGIEWTLLPNSGNTMKGLVGTGTTMYASRGFPWDPSTNLYEPFYSSPEDDGQTWTKVSSPMMSNGGKLQYDPVHHLLYSANFGAGVWRVVVD